MGKICLALVSKRNDSQKYQESKRFFDKKQGFVNWFI